MQIGNHHCTAPADTIEFSPGYFPSEMTTKESDENQKSTLPEEKIQEKGHVPAQRSGSDEMAQGVIF